MISCPVCEHQQDLGFECDVCGKDLSAALGTLGAPPVRIDKMVELEVTIPERVGEVAVEHAPDVEVTSFAKVEAGVLAPVPDFERTVAARVGEVAVLPLDELSEDRVADDGVRTPVSSGPLTCRYCKTVQALGSGLICERCGMKLPRVAVVAQAGAPAKKKETVWARCRSCGANAHAGERCGECGHDVPIPEA
jgi:hypothetical protein